MVPEFGMEDLREILYGDYRIVYECRPGVCYVKVVIHGSRELQRHFDPQS